MKRILFVLLLAMVAVAASACASSGDDVEPDGSGQMEGSVPGGAGDPAEATRDVIIEASDDLRFDPASIEVETGEVVTFVVRNTGKTDHEFILGDRAYQDMHEADMQGDAMMETDNAVTVAPGEKNELTWRFDEAGEVLYGCHEPGHYDGGMVGSIEVTGA